MEQCYMGSTFIWGILRTLLISLLMMGLKNWALRLLECARPRSMWGVLLLDYKSSRIVLRLRKLNGPKPYAWMCLLGRTPRIWYWILHASTKELLKGIVLHPFFRNQELGGNENNEMPSEDDWTKARRLCTFLEKFYELTLHVSGSLYVTSSFFMK